MEPEHYDKGHWLDVVWRCARYHRKEEGMTQNTGPLTAEESRRLLALFSMQAEDLTPAEKEELRTLAARAAANPPRGIRKP